MRQLRAGIRRAAGARLGGRRPQAGDGSRPRPISGSRAAISGPLSRPVSARRSGRNRALPARPVARLELRDQSRPRAHSLQSSAAASSAAAASRSRSSGSAGRSTWPCRIAHQSAASSTRLRLGRIASQSRLGHAGRQPGRHRGERQLVDDAGVEALQLLEVEPRRRPAEGGEIERGDQRLGARRPARPAGWCRSAPASPSRRSARCPRARSSSRFIEPEPLRQFALGADQQAPRARRPAPARPAPRTSAPAPRCW